MEFRRNGHRDERRRRVLIDEMRGAAIRKKRPVSKGRRSVVADARTPALSGDYAAAAQDCQQPPVTCLIPKRLWSVTVLVLTGLTLVVGVEFLYTNVFHAAPAAHRELTKACDVTASGSFMSWLSSLLLLFAATGSVMVYAVRRHRLDDYRGRYRIWLWGAAGCTIGSIDAATGLHNALATLLTEVAGTPLFGDGSIWWLLVFAVVYGAGLLWLALEIRPCVAALISLLLASAGYAAAAAVALQLLLPQWGMLTDLIGSSCVMLGHLGIAVTVIVYCRHVHGEAQYDAPDVAQDSAEREEPPSRPRSRSRRQAAPVRFDAAHDSPRANSGKDGSATDLDAAPSDSGEAVEGGRRLSKSERRRLRKQARRKRRSDA